MGLANTLIKVAIGVAVAKGVSTLVKGNSQSGGSASRRPSGVEDIMKGVGGFSGGSDGGKPVRRYEPETQQGGGLGDLLGQLTGQSSAPRQRQNAPRGGLEDLLGGGQSSQGGGLGDLLGQLTGATGAARGATQGGGLGDLLGAVLGGAGMGGAAGGAQPAGRSARDEDLSAALILRAMISAVKADGKLDAGEKDKLMQQLGDASREEIAYVNAEMERNSDADDIASQTPEGMEAQVYIMSLMAIDLDNQKEAQYLDRLARALSLTQSEVNALHDRAGAPALYN